MKTKRAALVLFIIFSLLGPIPARGAESDAFVLFPSQIEAKPASTYTFTLIALGTQGIAKFSLKDIPAGCSYKFDEEEVNLPGVTKLHLTTAENFLPGDYLIEIACDFGDQVIFSPLSLKKEKTLEMEFIGDQSLLWPGQKIELALLLHTASSSNLSFSLNDLPSQIHYKLSDPIRIDMFSLTSTLSFEADPDIKPGVYKSSLSVSDGTNMQKTDISLTVMFPDCCDHWAARDIGLLLSQGGISGYPDGNFRPDVTVSRAELAKMLSLSFDLKLIKPESANFTDLNPTHWAFPYIERLYKGGIISGYPDGSFRADDPVKRAEVASMIAKIFNWRLVPENHPPTFIDLDQSHWAFRFIETGAWQGCLDGYPDGSFQPEKGITRGEISSLIILLKNRNN